MENYSFSITRMNFNNSHGFGRLPDPPEPDDEECDETYHEGSCEFCDFFDKCLEKWRDE